MTKAHSYQYGDRAGPEDIALPLTVVTQAVRTITGLARRDLYRHAPRTGAR